MRCLSLVTVGLMLVVPAMVNASEIETAQRYSVGTDVAMENLPCTTGVAELTNRGV